MDGQVLVLNSDYQPLNVCNIRRAIGLVHLGKADVLHEDGRCVHTARETFVTPSVVRLRHHVTRPAPELRLSRRSIFARDGYTCQYCGATGVDLTVDHVAPKRLGGRSTWENLVCSCKRCNTRKGDKTLQQAGMRLRRQPRKPKYIPFISLAKYLDGKRNEVWRMYLPTLKEF
jgi:5-methylcytosine-specific restriction endonuclease McrA